MSEYNPDAWVVVELSGTDVPKTYHRILAGWYGGYLNGDSWKMNSGITKIVKHENYYEVHGDSGSVYNCPKQAERFSSYMMSVFSNFAAQNCKEITLAHVDMNSILGLYVAPVSGNS